MDWNMIMDMQKVLDDRIMDKINRTRAEVNDEKLLALLVEVGELANETRCFKFWSEKGPNDRQYILEEYVDGIHFLISIGLDRTYTIQPTIRPSTKSLTEQFHGIYDGIVQYKSNPTEKRYHQLLSDYLSLGDTLGFNETDIFKAYQDKNEVNHERQKTGY
uniref:dUTP diphosphatase n=1 Tax=uncultured Allobacillus sp. TaxID=1638025 RepID=UPI0025992C2E|nr:dUTP diphosphatase [uncultured Allobacillus sp.]